MSISTKPCVFLGSLILASCLSGCYSTSGPTALVSPLTTSITGPKPGERGEQDLPNLESARLCFATAESLESGGKLKEAINLYEKARQLDPHLKSEATRRLAVLFDRSGEFDKALDEYHRGLEENPKDAALLNDLGYGYYCRGQWTPAETNLRKALAANPKLVGAWNNLGMTLAQQGKYDESLAAFAKVVTKAQAHCNLAFILATQAKIDDARQNYMIAIQYEPGLQIARVALEKLNRKSSDPPIVMPADGFTMPNGAVERK
jgi:tetratricopeptide (TPR) repeat protein